MTNDEARRFNRERWEALAKNRVLFSRPWLNLDRTSAADRLQPALKDVDFSGKEVLCIASGGGQQSAALSILGARVTVLDFSETQLARDREAADFYGYEIRTVLGDMRDLSSFDESSFDIAWQPFSINYVKEVDIVIRGVARIVRDAGFYQLDFANPFAMGRDERSWDGRGYPLARFYTDGEMVEPDPAEWEIWNEEGDCQTMEGPRQFRHTFSRIVNTLVDNGFNIRRLWESVGDPAAVPGTWDHFIAIVPQIIGVWSRLSK